MITSLIFDVTQSATQGRQQVVHGRMRNARAITSMCITTKGGPARSDSYISFLFFILLLPLSWYRKNKKEWNDHPGRHCFGCHQMAGSDDLIIIISLKKKTPPSGAFKKEGVLMMYTSQNCTSLMNSGKDLFIKKKSFIRSLKSPMCEIYIYYYKGKGYIPSRLSDWRSLTSTHPRWAAHTHR